MNTEKILLDLVDIVETIAIAVDDILYEEDSVDIQNRLYELKIMIEGMK